MFWENLYKRKRKLENENIFMKLTNLNINKTYRGRKRENRRNHT